MTIITLNVDLVTSYYQINGKLYPAAQEFLDSGIYKISNDNPQIQGFTEALIKLGFLGFKKKKIVRVK